MTPENFIYWLQGFFEITNPTSITEEQTKMIKEYLDLCFTKVTGEKRKTFEEKVKEKINIEKRQGLKQEEEFWKNPYIYNPPITQKPLEIIC